jgi:hypothetical protein
MAGSGSTEEGEPVTRVTFSAFTAAAIAYAYARRLGTRKAQERRTGERLDVAKRVMHAMLDPEFRAAVPDGRVTGVLPGDSVYAVQQQALAGGAAYVAAPYGDGIKVFKVDVVYASPGQRDAGEPLNAQETEAAEDDTKGAEDSCGNRQSVP